VIIEFEKDPIDLVAQHFGYSPEAAAEHYAAQCAKPRRWYEVAGGGRCRTLRRAMCKAPAMVRGGRGAVLGHESARGVRPVRGCDGASAEFG